MSKKKKKTLPKGMVRRKRRGKRYAYFARKRRTIDGKVKEKWTLLGYTETDARKAYQSLKQTPEVLSPTAFQGARVRDLVPRFERTYVRVERNEAGQALVKQRNRDFVVPFFGHKRLERITPDTVREFVLWLQEEHARLAPQTVKHIAGQASNFFRWCVEEGLLARSPMPHRLRLKVQERMPEPFDDEQVHKLEAMLEPWGLVLRLAFATGLRRGELEQVEFRDIKSNGLLHVCHNTKNKQSRSVPLPEELVREVEALQAGRKRDDTLMPAGKYTTIVRHIRTHSGVEAFRWHRTRHTFACRFLENGGRMEVLQRLLGHGSITVTEQRYGRMRNTYVLAEARHVQTNTNPIGT